MLKNLKGRIISGNQKQKEKKIKYKSIKGIKKFLKGEYFACYN
jgi:hypothetical protein